MIHLKAENYIEAEGDLRDALATEPAMADQLPAYTGGYLHAVLAITLFEEGHRDEAKAEAHDLCVNRWPPHALVKIKTLLGQAGLCS